MKGKLFLFLFFFAALTVPSFAQSDTDLKNRPGAQAVPPNQVYAQAQVTPAAPASIQQGASAEIPVPVDYTNPDSYFDQGLIGTIKAGLLAIIAALGGVIPGLRNIAGSTKGAKLISSGVVAFLALTALATFRAGALTENFFQLITGEFLPNFAYAGLLYSAYKLIIGLIPKKAASNPAV